MAIKLLCPLRLHVCSRLSRLMSHATVKASHAPSCSCWLEYGCLARCGSDQIKQLKQQVCGRVLHEAESDICSDHMLHLHKTSFAWLLVLLQELCGTGHGTPAMTRLQVTVPAVEANSPRRKGDIHVRSEDRNRQHSTQDWPVLVSLMMQKLG